jgi:sulfur-carrier protein
VVVEVLFFARIREQLGIDKLRVPLTGSSPNIATLIEQLIVSHGGAWAEVLGADNVVKAVNQEVVAANHPLSEGDEVAFFPPVTGG